MKTFIYHDIPKLNRIDSGGKRFYQTPTGEKYPSVTSVVGFKKEADIQKWRDKIGEEEANRISARASSRGTRIHLLCEKYLRGEDPQPTMFDLEMYETLIPELDKINNIHALETQLFSHTLEVAGTVDCIAEYDGLLSVIDFKTSRRIKYLEDIPNYFQQTAAYAHMFGELTGLQIEQLVIIMGVDDEPLPLVFNQPTMKWLKEFQDIRREFKICKGY